MPPELLVLIASSALCLGAVVATFREIRRDGYRQRPTLQSTFQELDCLGIDAREPEALRDAV